ncbi:hypothetical protein E2C01_012814 [Portunus trituberculatus]|uniref:Uncharacterized protein n=1 Tax=Portunus trituberculatus TaxID=210409 RepID=A0A5B7DF33_PORTR|nr:hypothetical protein [Portunus trituberculatus]
MSRCCSQLDGALPACTYCTKQTRLAPSETRTDQRSESKANQRPVLNPNKGCAAGWRRECMPVVVMVAAAACTDGDVVIQPPIPITPHILHIQAPRAQKTFSER